jgi:hypothetical protein
MIDVHHSFEDKLIREIGRPVFHAWVSRLHVSDLNHPPAVKHGIEYRGIGRAITISADMLFPSSAIEEAPTDGLGRRIRVAQIEE